MKTSLLAVVLMVGVVPFTWAAPRVVRATVETPPLFDDDAGSSADADDPAVWVHPDRPAASLVLATKKNAGLSVYTLTGRAIQNIAPPSAPTPDDEAGRFNNVDVLYGLTVAGRAVDVAVVTDRGRDQLRFYRIDPAAAIAGGHPLVDITAPSVPFVFSADQAEVNEQATAYGLAVTPASRHRAFAFATRRSRADVAALEIRPAPGGRLTYVRHHRLRLPTRFRLPNGATWTPCTEEDDEAPQAEGMVVDVVAGLLYIAHETVGIWRVDLDLDDATIVDGPPRLIDKVRHYGVPYTRVFDPEEEEFVCTYDFANDPAFGGRHLTADAEGLTVYYADDDEDSEDGYLIASSQGDNTFVVYRRAADDDDPPNRFLGTFAVADGPSIDSVQHSDGATVVNVPLGRAFPRGLFVTHDGENTPEVVDPDTAEPRANTNFKLVPWPDIAKAFVSPLAIEPSGFDPRD